MKEWTRYKVTEWDTDNPRKVMYVYTNEITEERVTGQQTTDDYRFPSTSKWSRTMADKWEWREVTI